MTSITEILRFVHKYILMGSNSYFKVNNTSAKNFGLDFQTKSWLTLKRKKKL